ncbi:hypothetical protein VP168E361_P0030 [Vibrio phage 168E36-1]|nr:hypothetical protein VP168E361_P0030 [Vibrio phage 168E36-1]
MTVSNLAHGRDVCDKILTAVGANPDLLSTHDSVEVWLSVGEKVKIWTPDETNGEYIETDSKDAFNNLIEFCNIPNQNRCIWLSIKMEKDCLVTIDMSAHLELKDE